MSDTPMIVETGNGFNNMNPYAFGGLGSGWAAGLGGLILGTMWGNGGFGGFGGNQGAAVAAMASQDRTQLANAVEHVSDQVTQGTISGLESAQNTQNAIHQSAMANVQAQNANSMAVMAGNSQISDKICCSTGRLSQEIDSTGDNITAALTNGRIQDMQNTQAILGGMSNLGQAITSQGYQAQLTAKDQTILLGGQHSQIMAAIADSNARSEQQHCQDRELMRQIATESLQAKLAEAQAKIVQLETQNYVNQSNSQQTLYLINQLKSTTTPTTATAGA